MATSNPLLDAGKVLIIGNGGSYANAMHIANDLLSVGVKAFTCDPATLTAFANDHGWYKAFRLWVEVVGEKGDLLIALSGSGRSPNILEALEAARERGMQTLAIFGAYNEHGNVSDTLVEGGDTMQEAEEHHLAWGHETMLKLRQCLRPKS